MRTRTLILLLALALLALPLPAAAQSSAPLEFLGQAGGTALAVAAQGDLAAICIGPQLALVDVSDPAAPVELGRTRLPDIVSGIALAGGYAYVAARSAGLHVVDIADPTHPAEVAACASPGIAYGVVISGTVAYVAAGAGGLQLVDLSDPLHPQQVGLLALANREVRAVAVWGAYAYIAHRTLTNGFAGTVDVSDPADPWLRSSTEVQGQPNGITVAWPYAYVATAGQALEDGYLEALDISNPADIRPAGPLYGPVLDVYRQAEAVAVRGHYAYVGSDTGIIVADISDPGRPAYKRSLGGGGRGLALCGERLYVAGGRNGLRIVDVSTPGAPVEAGAYNAPMARIIQTVGQGEHVYAIKETQQYWEPNLIAYAGAGPGAFTPLATYPWRISDLDVQGDLAYLLTGSELQVTDVSDPAHPSILGVSSGAGGMALRVVGCRVYIAGEEGLRILDVSNPAQPTLIGSGPGIGRAFDVAGSLVLALDGESLRVLDVSDPAQPQPRGLCYLDAPRRVRAAGHYAYVTTPGGLQVVDFSDPANPTAAGEFPLVAGAGDVAVAGSLAAVTGGDGRLYVLDIADPTQPRELARRVVPGAPQRISLSGTTIYVAAGDGGIAVFRYAPYRTYLPLGSR